MNYLIIGANGQLGRAFQARYPEAQAIDSDQLDLTDPNQIAKFDFAGIDVILNAAAYTNVDGAESPEGRVAAWAINATAVGALATQASRHGITLVHISSEYVFDGTNTPHTEQEPFSPLGVYAQSKAAGEIAAATTPKHYIVRTSWLIGDGNNFVRTMYGLAQKNISPTVVHDQVGRLTFTDYLVEAIALLLSNQPAYGTYNVSNTGDPASWADITRCIFEYINRDDLTVTNTTTAEYFINKPTSAPRPLQSTLDLSKIAAVGLPPQDWKTALSDYISDYQTKLQKENS